MSSEQECVSVQTTKRPKSRNLSHRAAKEKICLSEKSDLFQVRLGSHVCICKQENANDWHLSPLTVATFIHSFAATKGAIFC
eukprot:6486316-Amphidinium_carterae.2